MTNRPTISACLIVRNEAARLPRCLASLVDRVDEIIVVDTGSTDATRDVAQRAGAKVSSFAWIDDFSAARNIAIERATGDWVLSIDADEWLAPGGADSLYGAVANERAVAYRVTLVNHLDGGRREPESLTRLFRRREEIRFRGRVHEQVTESVAAIVACAGGEWLDLHGCSLEHDGYLSSVLVERNKKDRNLSLLEAAVRESGDDDYLRYKLAIELGTRGHEHLSQVTLRLTERSASFLRSHPWTQAALINGALGVSESVLAERAIAICEAAFGKHPALCLARARILSARGDASAALVEVLAAKSAGGHGPGFDHAALTLELDLLGAALATSLGDYEEAMSLLSELRRTHPSSPRPIYALMELALALGDTNSALALGLTRLRESSGDAVALRLCAQAAEQSGDSAVADKWRAAAALA